MNILAKILLISICFCIHTQSSASHVEGEEKTKLSQTFFPLLESYPNALLKALEAGDVSMMRDVVEVKSPYYEFLEFAKENNDFILPYRAGGIRIISLPILPFMMAKEELIKNKQDIKIIRDQTHLDIFSFGIEGVEIMVRYKDDNMKIFRLKSYKISDFYGKPMLRKFFL